MKPRVLLPADTTLPLTPLPLLLLLLLLTGWLRTSQV